ncbi:MAG: SUMF1/EgtB/PvdO family nonheme iron enzyme [Aureispira sp.]|nr:SUMF1/EgtB/PvdO family nonheme iron enzyme [Aureispira sp.]
MKKIYLLSLVIIVAGMVALQSFETKGDPKKAKKAKKIVKDFLTDLKRIEGGTFLMGKPWESSNENFPNIYTTDSLWLATPLMQTVAVPSFYMGAKEITNKEYRQFVTWVRDSIAHAMLGHTVEYDDGSQGVDWDQELDWYPGGELDGMFYQGDEQFAGKRELDVRQLVFDYQYYDYTSAARDFDATTDYVNNSREKFNRADYIKKDAIRVYPDTLSWTRDLPKSYSNSMLQYYFSDPSYDDYPVVGISYNQAMAYCYWRSNEMKKQLTLAGYKGDFHFRLPTETEWEYAAIGAEEGSIEDIANYPSYPWNGNTLKKEGIYQANLGPIIDNKGNWLKHYPELKNELSQRDTEHYIFTAPTASFPANANGLYDMAGNVAEWVLNRVMPPNHETWSLKSNVSGRYLNYKKYKEPSWFAMDSIGYVQFVLAAWQQEGFDTKKGSTTRTQRIDPTIKLGWHDLQLSLAEDEYNRPLNYIVKGGSWAHEPRYLASASRMAVARNSNYSWMGFRVVMTTSMTSEQLKKWIK